MIIGIVGESGAGKSEVCRYLDHFGFYIINVDDLAKSLYEKKDSVAYKQIVSVFGKKVLMDNGSINKKYLGRVIFKNKTKMQELNTIMFPLIYEAVKKELLVLGPYKDIVIDAALLLKTDLLKSVELTIIVTADRKIRIERLLKRGVDKDIAEYMADALKITNKELSKADLILFNSDNNNLEGLKKELRVFLEKYRSMNE